jgi:hypothetical protein
VKSASAKVSFYTNNPKTSNFEFWHSCWKWAILSRCLHLADTISVIALPWSGKQLWQHLCHLLSESSITALRVRWYNINMDNECELLSCVTHAGDGKQWF